LAAAYIWSRPGQTTHLHLEARGSHVAAYVDGHLQVEGTFPDAPPAGGVAINMQATNDVPSLPEPRGIDSVTVTGADGTVLFHDGFSTTPTSGSDWTVDGTVGTQSGVLTVPKGQALLRVAGPDWRDYDVDITFRNMTGATVQVRAPDDKSGVAYGFRPFRHLDNGLAVVAGGRAGPTVSGPVLELSRYQTIRSMVAMVLRPYPVLLLLLLAACVAVAVLQFAPPPPAMRTARVARALPWLIAAVLAGVSFGVTLFLNYSYESHIPHVPDEVSYIFQARVFAGGHLSAPPPPVPKSFDFFYPPLIAVGDGKWASVYPFGHPLVLAIGVRVGAIWLIPPLIGACCVALTFVVGRKIYGARAAQLAALLLVASPFFLMNASNFMSHNTAVFYVLLSLVFLAYADRRPYLYPLLAGVFFGLVFNTRPLTAFGLVPPFGVMLLSFLKEPDHRRMGVKQIAGFAGGGFLMLLAYWGYNLGTTGDAFTVASSQASTNVIGFAGTHSVSAGIENEHTQMAFLLLVFENWSTYIGLMLVLLPFVLGTRKVWDWFLLGCAVCVMGAYTLYYANGLMYGPRYWYEAMPFLILLAARGADRAATVAANVGARLRQAAFGGAPPSADWAGVTVVYTFVILLALIGTRGWLRDKTPDWGADLVPSTARSLRGFNGVNDRLPEKVEEAELHDALVLVAPCANWQCYGTVFWRNSPHLDGNIVYAIRVDSELPALFARYPDRRVYLADYLKNELTPFKLESTAPAPKDAPRASEIRLPTATPTATPTQLPPTPTPTPVSPTTAPTGPTTTPIEPTRPSTPGAGPTRIRLGPSPTPVH
jgi:hypothetical protein